MNLVRIVDGSAEVGVGVRMGMGVEVGGIGGRMEESDIVGEIMGWVG